MSNNLKYIDKKNGIEFTEVRNPQILFKNGPLGIKDRIKHDGTEVTEIDSNDTSPLINAVDIDWNGIDVGDSESINTTGDLIAWIKKKGSGGGTGGTVLNKPLASVNNLLYGFPYEAGLVLTYNGSTYEWRKSSLQSTEKPINYLWAYTVAENDTLALNKLSRTSKNTPPNSNYSITPINPPEGQYLYMTTARKRGEDYLPWDGGNVWSIPVRIGDNTTSGTGTDGDGYNYIYCLTTTEDIPNLPSSITVDVIEQYEGTDWGISTNGTASQEKVNVWRDHPNGVSITAGYEWIAVAKSNKSNKGTWGSYSAPVLWSKYGFDGKDGDSIEYVYRVTAANVEPTLSAPYTGRVGDDGDMVYNINVDSPTYQEDDFIPQYWFDNPQSLTVSNPVQWVSVRKQTDSVWGEFSAPTKWSENSITETIVDAPYIITNDNPWICVACDYNGNPVITTGSYGTAVIKALKGTTPKTDDFNWTASASGVTSGMDVSDDEVTISPRNLTVDNAEITITGTLKTDSNIVLSTKVTVAKIKATLPGTIPTIYELSISKPFAIKGDSTITTSVKIDVNKIDSNGKNVLTSIAAINNLLLHLYVNNGSSETEITEDNVLSAGELTDYFTGKQVGDTITIILRDSNNKTWDYGYITLIATGGTNIINNYTSDDFIFSLKRNNITVELDGDYSSSTDGMVNPKFTPNPVLYQIVGSKEGDAITNMLELFPIPADGTLVTTEYWSVYPEGSCSASIVHNPEGYDAGVYILIIPLSTKTGGTVTIECFRDAAHQNYWGNLVATYNLEKSSYTIKQSNKGLSLSGLSATISGYGEQIAENKSQLEHTSKQLTSTIESQYVFPNLFGFSNGLTFDNSEPFIQAYGAEIIPGTVPSSITGFNVDTTQNIVVSMDAYREGSGTYKCYATFNNVDPSKVTIDSQDASTENFTLAYNSKQHVVMYFENLSSTNEGLKFTVSEGTQATRMMLFNLKVEYGYTPTKFCISDEDAAVNNNTDLLKSDMTVPDWSTVKNTYSKNTVDSYSDVHCFIDVSIESNDTWLLYHPTNHAMAANKVFTLSFLAKSDKANTHIESIVYIETDNAPRQLGNYTYTNADAGIFNSPEDGLTVHTLTTEWKKCYARFYVSSSAVGQTLRPVIKIYADNEHPAIDFNNGGNASDTRSVYITNIQFQEGYTPSDDQIISDNAHTKSLINQTSSEINLQVENRMRKSGITLTADGVTINATKVAFTGADGIDYIRLGEDEDGVPYFIFCDAEGNEKWHFGLNGPQEVSSITRAQGWTALLVKAINDANFDNTKEVFTAAEIYPILINSTLSGYDYAENVTYQRYVAAITNGVMNSGQAQYDGLYYRTTSTDSNGVPINPDQPIANSNDMWWIILRSRTQQDPNYENISMVYGDFAIITNGKYYSIGTLGVRKNGSNYMFWNSENSIMNYLSYDNSNNVNESGELDLGRTQEALDKIGYYDNN